MTATTRIARRTGPFIATKEHRRFVEFADTVRRHATIGLCHGPAGVGKTMSARRYSRWDTIEPHIELTAPRVSEEPKACAALARSLTVFYTPVIGATFKDFVADVTHLIARARMGIDEHHSDRLPSSGPDPRAGRHVELIIVDEAERLGPLAVEYFRDKFDRYPPHGLIFIGMPGLEKSFSRYPQLFSRIGFAHRYRTLTGEELEFVLARHWRSLGLSLNADDFADAQAIALVAQLTGGNFRLLHRLFQQIERVMRINELSVISTDVIETARSTLVLGTS